MAVTPDEAAVLVARARDGDSSAWDALVDAYVGLVWSIARNHRLGTSDAADVSQTTWLRLLENIDRIEDPRRVGAWLATTARRECLRLLRLSGRQVPVEAHALEHVDEDASAVDAMLLQAEQSVEVQAAFVRLPERCQRLLRLLLTDPAPSYEEVSATLAMPIGSIGPTRGRCLDKLRVLLQEDAGPGRP